ncbi:hypothetical protein Tco_0122746 [Tanacetum coccineum]
MVFHNEDGNPARANIKQALGYLKDGDGDGNSHYERPHKGVKASANSDIMYFFTSAQDGDPLQDDVRLCLGDDLKKAQDHRVTSLRGRLLGGEGFSSSLQNNPVPLGALKENSSLQQSYRVVSAGSSSSVSAGYIIEFMLEDLEAVPADYVPAGHVLISADRYRIC